jgi:hypothetical protein
VRRARTQPGATLSGGAYGGGLEARARRRRFLRHAAHVLRCMSPPLRGATAHGLECGRQGRRRALRMHACGTGRSRASERAAAASGARTAAARGPRRRPCGTRQQPVQARKVQEAQTFYLSIISKGALVRVQRTPGKHGLNALPWRNAWFNCGIALHMFKRAAGWGFGGVSASGRPPKSLITRVTGDGSTAAHTESHKITEYKSAALRGARTAAQTNPSVRAGDPGVLKPVTPLQQVRRLSKRLGRGWSASHLAGPISNVHRPRRAPLAASQLLYGAAIWLKLSPCGVGVLRGGAAARRCSGTGAARNAASREPAAAVAARRAWQRLAAAAHSLRCARPQPRAQSRCWALPTQPPRSSAGVHVRARGATQPNVPPPHPARKPTTSHARTRSGALTRAA